MRPAGPIKNGVRARSEVQDHHCISSEGAFSSDDEIEGRQRSSVDGDPTRLDRTVFDTDLDREGSIVDKADDLSGLEVFQRLAVAHGLHIGVPELLCTNENAHPIHTVEVEIEIARVPEGHIVFVLDADGDRR